MGMGTLYKSKGTIKSIITKLLDIASASIYYATPLKVKTGLSPLQYYRVICGCLYPICMF